MPETISQPLSKYNPMMRNHLKCVKKNKKKHIFFLQLTSWLHIQCCCLSAIWRNKWYDICFYSMLDLSHHEQLTQTIQFVDINIIFHADVFLNLIIALQILLIRVSLASCEMSFSKMKLILMYLRTSLTQEWLSHLVISNIKRDVLNLKFC